MSTADSLNLVRNLGLILPLQSFLNQASNACTFFLLAFIWCLNSYLMDILMFVSLTTNVVESQLSYCQFYFFFCEGENFTQFSIVLPTKLQLFLNIIKAYEYFTCNRRTKTNILNTDTYPCYSLLCFSYSLMVTDVTIEMPNFYFDFMYTVSIFMCWSGTCFFSTAKDALIFQTHQCLKIYNLTAT